MKIDLNNIDRKVVFNQMPPTGTRCFIEINGLQHEYYHDDDLFIVQRFVNKLKAEIGWFEKISKHAPTLADFYEHLIHSVIQEVLPSSL